MNATKLSASYFLIIELNEGQITIFSGMKVSPEVGSKIRF